MSIEQYQREVNSLDREIATLEKKKAEIDGKYAALNKKIFDTKKSITPRTPASIATSRIKQVSSWQSDCAKKSAESADLGKKIADKKKRRNDAYLKLQRAQRVEQNEQESQLRYIQKKYEKRIAQLQNSYRSSNISAEVAINNAEYDVFISHAWEDKESFTDEFVSELNKLNLRVWYDKNQIRWGDSMRAKIDEGLKKSKFGVVVLSPDYIKEGKYWTKAELDGLFQLESVNGKTLLPIWHNLTKKEVLAFSPIIANKLAMTTASMTPSEIAIELAKLLPK